MSDEKTDFTINVKVNGLEDVERLRKALEGITTGTKHPEPGQKDYEVRVNFDKPKAERFHEPELSTFKVGETCYRIAPESVPVVQAAIRSALAVTNPRPCAEADTVQRFTYRGRVYAVSTGPVASDVKPTARFKVGDTVRLVSGGVRMTVAKVNQENDLIGVAASLLGTIQRDAYPAVCLEVVS